jgi:hypothetical protein
MYQLELDPAASVDDGDRSVNQPVVDVEVQLVGRNFLAEFVLLDGVQNGGRKHHFERR